MTSIRLQTAALAACYLIGAWLAVAVGSAAAAAAVPLETELVDNGGFEQHAGEAFDSWTPSRKGRVASASVAPSVVDGKRSAKLTHGGGFLLQTVCTEGVAHFTLELDFAVLDTASSGVRSFGLVTYATTDGSHNGADNIDSIRVYTTAPQRHQVQIFNHGRFQDTDLFAKATPDDQGDLRFDGGESPVVNHLKIEGTGYGTPSQRVTITLTSGASSKTCTRRLCYVGTNSPLKAIGLYSGGSAADYLVDNVSLRARPAPPPEPDMLDKALAHMGGAEEVVFAVRGLYEDGHYYANFGHWSSNPNKMMYAAGGSRLCKLNLRTKQVTVLLEDPQGGLRDPRIDYDGRKLLFSYRPGGTKYHHLYEMQPDGSGLKQLTFGPWDDVEPAFLPDGGIVFVSSRGDRFVPCYHTQVGLLYRMDADGGNMRLLSGNNVGDHRPAILPSGQVLYTRWEYVDRAPQKFHTLWTMNPDGTDQMIVYGNMLPPSGYDVVPRRPYVVMIDALPIPQTSNLVAVFSPGHGNRENAGNVVVVDPDAGPDDPASARQISPPVKMAGGWAGGRGGFRDPYPLAKDCFLVARDKSLLILDDQGRTQEVYQADDMLHDPRVIRPRRREPVLAPRSDPQKAMGRLVLSDIYHGRNMRGVKRGEVKKLLVMEDLPKPVSYYSLPGALSMDGTHTIKRILGTVPVEADGSAYLEIPALRGILFAALDEHGMAVKRMQSYVTVMPGETLGCVGCHENRTETALLRGNLMAMNRRPSRIEPIADIPEVIDYPRDVQPILDKHCVECHSAEKPEGRVVLTGDYNEWFSLSYYELFASKQVSDSWRYDEDGNHAPREFGSSASALMNKVDGSHYGVRVSARDHQMLRLWIDAGATYPGTYAAYNEGRVAVAGALVNTPKVAISGTVGQIVDKRCLGCHSTVATLGRRHEKGRVNLPKHCWNLYNLSHPEKSMILLAPLAKEAGGYGWCMAGPVDGKPDQPARVFRDPGDPDYQAILAAIQAAKVRRGDAHPFDMPGFRANEHYVRWMKRFGILPESFDAAKDPIDPYATDEAYWRSLWYRPGTQPPSGQHVSR